LRGVQLILKVIRRLTVSVDFQLERESLQIGKCRIVHTVTRWLRNMIGFGYCFHCLVTAFTVGADRAPNQSGTRYTGQGR